MENLKPNYHRDHTHRGTSLSTNHTTDGRMVDGMSMNIKNQETYKLARELAAATGESLTEAVTLAVRERLERLGQKNSQTMSQRLLAIGKECAPTLRQVGEHGDLLYDDKGLPK